MMKQKVKHVRNKKTTWVLLALSPRWKIVTKEIFNQFLVLLYCGMTPLNYLSRNDWVDIKWLCIDWHLSHQTVMIIQRFCEIQIQLYSSQYRYFLESFTFQHINCRQHQTWRYHWNVVDESISEDIVIVEDDWILGGGYCYNVSLSLTLLCYFYSILLSHPWSTDMSYFDSDSCSSLWLIFIHRFDLSSYY
jgi:hypothetical protein